MPRAILVLLLIAPYAAAQPDPAGGSLDQRLLIAIYEQDGELVRSLVQVVDRPSTAVFVLGSPLLAAGTLLSKGGDFSPAYRMGLTQVGTFAAVYALKQAHQRPRPYLVEEGIEPRSARRPAPRPSYSLPSTHAAMAAGMATSLSLSHPEWWVIVPAATWATLVSLSRPWLGLHYPSDVLAGWLVGGGAAVLVHLARDAVTPSVLAAPDSAERGVIVPLIRLHW